MPVNSPCAPATGCNRPLVERQRQLLPRRQLAEAAVHLRDGGLLTAYAGNLDAVRLNRATAPCRCRGIGHEGNVVDGVDVEPSYPQRQIRARSPQLVVGENDIGEPRSMLERGDFVPDPSPVSNVDGQGGRGGHVVFLASSVRDQDPTRSHRGQVAPGKDHGVAGTGVNG